MCKVTQLHTTEQTIMQIGTIVKIKPEYQDAGDNSIIWITTDIAEKNRVTIIASNSTLSIKPTYVVWLDWIEICKN